MLFLRGNEPGLLDAPLQDSSGEAGLEPGFHSQGLGDDRIEFRHVEAIFLRAQAPRVRRGPPIAFCRLVKDAVGSRRSAISLAAATR